jgi:hypothetical protein
MGALMLKWNAVSFEADNLESMVRLREQDDEFCRTLRAAVESGSEFCPTTVSTQPCTRRPILNYVRPD